MSQIHCRKCHAVCNVRKSKRRDKMYPDIVICGEVITHQDGSKEFREYGRINEKTDQIITMSL